MTGEAAGLAMGLCELGSKSAAAIEDMVAYAQETQHEKILRGNYIYSRDSRVFCLHLLLFLKNYKKLEKRQGMTSKKEKKRFIF